MGIYGVVSWTVNERHREIGIRLALGATPRAVLRQFTARALRLTLLGVLLGLPAALGTGRALAGLLFGVQPADPVTLLAVAALVILVGLAAAFGPSRRAAAVDPLVSLREESRQANRSRACSSAGLPLDDVAGVVGRDQGVTGHAAPRGRRSVAPPRCAPPA